MLVFFPSYAEQKIAENDRAEQKNLTVRGGILSSTKTVRAEQKKKLTVRGRYSLLDKNCSRRTKFPGLIIRLNDIFHTIEHLIIASQLHCCCKYFLLINGTLFDGKSYYTQ